MGGSKRMRSAGAGGSSPFTVRAVGDRACIVDLPDLDTVLGLAAILRERGFPGVIDIVPAARTVLVTCVDRASARRIADEIAGLPSGIAGFARSMLGESARVAIVDVVYDGEDLEAVGAMTGLSAAGVVAAHTGSRWTAAFGGFAPGFVYLTGGDAALRVPRLESPRERVAPGSVGLAGAFSAVYPGASPGGWRLIGRTTAQLWDATRERASLIAPGDTVTFRAVREQVALAVPVPVPDAPDATDAPSAVPDASPVPPEAASSSAITVIDPGMQTLVQDAGRAGHSAIGVSPSGAADRVALRRANRAVGNADGAAALETLNAALVVRADVDVSIALAGTDATAEIVGAGDERRTPPSSQEAFTVRRGEVLRVGRATRGMRGVLAIRGGFAVPRVLGSASHDSLSGIGPAPLAAGDALAIDDPRQADRAAHSPESDGRPIGDEVQLRFVPGPRSDWFDAKARAALASQSWRLSASSNRVGARFDGTPLRRARHDELPSEGTVRGSIQVPPNGLPVLFLADHPVTGGYPVIGTVIDADTDIAAQLRPGSHVRFVPVDPDDPHLGSRPDARSEIPEAVRLSFEVDGKRVAVTLPGALAAALDRLSATDIGDDGRLLMEDTVATLLRDILSASAAAAAGKIGTRVRQRPEIESDHR